MGKVATRQTATRRTAADDARRAAARMNVLDIARTTGMPTRSAVRDETALCDYLDRRLSELAYEREPWDYIWRAITEQVLPERQYLFGYYDANITTKHEASSYIRTIASNIFDTEAQRAIHLLTAGMQGYVLNQSSPWFAHTTTRRRMRELPGVLPYLQDVDEQLLNAVSRSNFYSESIPLIMDAAATGTATFWMEQMKDGYGYSFRCLPPSEVFIAENAMRQVDTVYRVFTMTKRQVIERFGYENISQRMRNARSDTETFQILHAVFPRTDAIDQEAGLTARAPRSILNMDAPYFSVYKELAAPDTSTSAPFSSRADTRPEDKKILGTEGFNYFPYCVWRWQIVTPAPYAIGPTQTILPQVYQSNFFAKILAQSAQLHVQPPFNIPSGLDGEPALVPGGYNHMTNPQERIEAILTAGGQYPIGLDREDRMARAIRDHYGVEYFLLVTGSQGSAASKTATEVLELQSEKAAVLNSMMGRLGVDVLRPMLSWLFNVERSMGAMPDLPPALGEFSGTPDGRLEIVYVSPLALAQRRLASVIGPLRIWESLVPIFQVDPTSIDAIDTAAFVRHLAAEGGMPMDVVRTMEMIEQRRRAAAERVQQQQSLENAEMIGRAMRNAGTDLQQIDSAAGGQQLAGLLEYAEAA